MGTWKNLATEKKSSKMQQYETQAEEGSQLAPSPSVVSENPK